MISEKNTAQNDSLVNSESTKAVSAFSCPDCKKANSLVAKANTVECKTCHTSFPLLDGNFIDFLSVSERKAISDESQFWEKHYGGTIYQDESEKSYQEWAKLMRVKPSDRVIEIGCGSGALLNRLPAKHKVGIEPVKGLLTKTTGFDAAIAVAERMPFPDATFDLTYFKHSLHHVVNKRAGFKESVRITKTNGRIIVIEPNLDHPQRRLTANPESFLRRQNWMVKFIGPVETFQTARELLDWAKEEGLEVLTVKFCESHYETLSTKQKLQKIYRFIGNLLLIPKKYLYPQYYLEFRKP